MSAFADANDMETGVELSTATADDTDTRITFCLPLNHTVLTSTKKSIPLGKIKTDLRVDITFNTLTNSTVLGPTLTKARIENPRIHYTEI